MTCPVMLGLFALRVVRYTEQAVGQGDPNCTLLAYLRIDKRGLGFRVGEYCR